MRTPLLLLLAGGLALRLVFFGGLLGWDDVEYAEAARRLLGGEPAPRSMFEMRYGVTLPLAAVQALFGAGEHAAALVPLAYSALEIVLGGALGALLGGPAVGLVAAALLGVLPLAVVAATDVHADLPASVFMALAMYAVLRADAGGRRRAAWLAGAGLALGLAYVTKEVALVLALVLAARILLLRRRAAGYAWLLAGFLAVVALDMAGSLWRAGDPLVRHAPAFARLHVEHMRTAPPGYGWMLAYPAMLLAPWSGSFGYFAGVFYLALAGAAWGLRAGERAVGELVVWWLPVLLVFNLAPLDGTLTRPLFVHFARTLHPLLIPLAVTAAFALVRGLGGRPAAQAAVAAGVLALAAAGIVRTHADHRAWAAVARQAAEVIRREPADTLVVADRLSVARLRVLLPERRAQITWWRDGGLARAGQAPLLVLSDPRLLRRDVEAGAPAAMLAPPAAWEPVAELFPPPRASLRGLLRRRLGAGREAPAARPPAPAVLWRVRPAAAGR